MVHRLEKRLKIVAIVVMTILAAACSPKDENPSVAEKVQASLEDNWNRYKAGHDLPAGGVAVYLETPTGNYFSSVGMERGIDQNSRFRIASNTKTFTSAAIMLLHQQGKLRVDDTIVSLIPGQGLPYVPNTPDWDMPFKATITIRQLLAHTAGVYDVDNNPVPSTCSVPYAGQSYPGYVLASDPIHQFTRDELVGVNARCQKSYWAPGTGYHYSDTGYSILATIIERVSGMSYDRFLMENLILPNGLSSTSVVMLGTDQTIPAPFNPGLIYYQGVTTDVTEDNMSLHVGEGNITSTPADIARWVRRLVRGEAGPNSVSVSTMLTPTSQALQSGSNYGLGISYMNGLGYGHTGANQGYLSIMMYDPSVDVTTIVYFNVWDQANLMTDQSTLMSSIARAARAAAGY